MNLATGTLSKVRDMLPVTVYNIAFDAADALYGIGVHSPGKLLTINVTDSTSAELYDTGATTTAGGAFCPL